ncbi:hypothetical protein ACE1B6_00690 [Aerosakkonemataceae cyanobacterium BLCC-F154]|uniref:Calcium-binding protein n=1 Tax=Floridaenema fluviatile BLCC-F154 TaxID=3153640 RepID=A0ABV4Y5I9_9CYAN
MQTFTVNTISDVVNPNDGVLSLREAIIAAGTIPGRDRIELQQSVFITSSLPILERGNDIDFIGQNRNTAINGLNRQIFTINGADVTFRQMTFLNGLAEGGDGVNGGGGGAGLGGALFINQGRVTVDDVIFSQNRAIGGDGTIGRTGGRGGNDSGTGNNGLIGGSGGLLNANNTLLNPLMFGGAGSGGSGGRGGSTIGSRNGSDAFGGNIGGFGSGGGSGGAGGGGGGGSGALFPAGNGGNGGAGGAGGFGGGGGAGGGGGGGGANVLLGRTGRGGSGGAGSAGGTTFGNVGGGDGGPGQAGGNGSSTFIGDSPGRGGIAGQGGGGGGLGGAIFVRQDATLHVNASSFSSNSATGGQGFERGTGAGSGVFIQNGANVTFGRGTTFENTNSSFRFNRDELNDPIFGSFTTVITGQWEDDIRTGDAGQNTFLFERNDRTDTVTNFTGIGQGINPPESVVNEVDTLQFIGEGFTAENLLLTPEGNNLRVSFAGIDDTQVILENVQLEDLDNLSTPGGNYGQLGNILFDGDTQIQDSFDVVNADSVPTQLGTANQVYFLNDLDNNVSGIADSNDVVNAQGGNDTITGLSGDDILRGGDGDDVLDGGVGADVLIGNAGNDRLYLGDDSDVDTVIYGNGDGSDIVHQFKLGAGGDLLQFAGVDAIDVVVNGSNTLFRRSSGTPEFGTGETLLELRDVTGLSADNIGLNISPVNTAQFSFA